MARVDWDGAEAGDMLFFDSPGTATNVTTTPRSGLRHYNIPGSGTASKTIAPLTELFVRACYYFPASNIAKFFKWSAGTTELGSIRKNTTSQLIEIYTGTATLVATGTHALQLNTYYMIEVRIKIDDSVGVLSVKIEGATALDATFSGDTKPGTDTTVDSLALTNPNSATAFYVDDIAINDTTTANDNSWCGDGKCAWFTPNGAGDVTQLTPSAGLNYQCVDEIPPNTTDYVSSATAGQYDLYAVSSYALATGEVVRRVRAEARSLEESATGDQVGLGIKTEATEYFDAGHVVTTSYARYVGTDHRVNPNTGLAFTQAELDALQVGVKVI